MVTLKKGSKNEYVKALQYILEIDADGIFGKNTEQAIRTYQKSKELVADSIVGKNTYAAIVKDAPTIKVGSSGKWVNVLECLLQTMAHDGIFKVDEKAHVKTFQTSANLVADGVVGQKTWAALFGLSGTISANNSSNSGSSGGTNTKQPVNYKQYDSKWKKVIFTKNNTYNKTQNIGNSGCGPTAMADIVATWWDKKVTPVEMCALAVDAGFRTENNGTSWSFFKYVAKKYKASNFIQTSSYATAEKAIKNGAYVVCSVGPGVWTKHGHYICWWKVDDTYVYICDPGGSSIARAKSKKSNLRSQAKQYFIFYK